MLDSDLKPRVMRGKYFFAGTLAMLPFALFFYGILVGKLEIFPYRELRKMWSSAPHAVKKAVSTSLASTASVSTSGVVDTNLLPLEASAFNRMNERGITGDGGAITRFGSYLVGVDRKGNFFLYEKGGVITKLQIDLDTNRKEFERHVRATVENESFRRSIDRYFRVMDIVADTSAAGGGLIVSYHYWHPEQAAKTLRVARLPVRDAAELVPGKAVSGDAWEVMYESHPPVELDESPFNAMRTNHTGGRMALDGQGGLYVGIGEQRYDGIRYPLIASQDDLSSYGKIVRVDLRSLGHEIYAKGVRNPQGLYFDREGNLWETEHGPRGGDELNLVRRGANYGWPIVTHGTDENKYTWPHSDTQGRHDRFVRPVYAWVPSVGVSNLIQVNRIPAQWDGDLLVSSLSGLTLYRMHIREERVIFAEPIHVGERIRDLEQLEDGTILIFADNGVFVELQPASGEQASGLGEGFQLTAAEEEAGLEAILGTCTTCHSFGPASGTAAAPSLSGVFGRKIGGSNFQNYSSALKSVNGTWDEGNLKAYISTPQGFAPGTIMPDQGVVDEATLDALIAFLKRQK